MTEVVRSAPRRRASMKVLNLRSLELLTRICPISLRSLLDYSMKSDLMAFMRSGRYCCCRDRQISFWNLMCLSSIKVRLREVTEPTVICLWYSLCYRFNSLVAIIFTTTIYRPKRAFLVSNRNSTSLDKSTETSVPFLLSSSLLLRLKSRSNRERSLSLVKTRVLRRVSSSSLSGELSRPAALIINLEA